MPPINKVYEYKSIPFEVKDIDLGARKLSQYFSAFNVRDAAGDLVLPGFFTKTLQEIGPKSAKPRLKHLLNHDIQKPIGLPEDAIQDNYGLLVTSNIGSHWQGEDFIKMVESGLITEGSMGYQVVKGQKVDKGRNLIEGRVMEVSSLTGWGVNEWTPITAMKSEDQLSHAIARLEKLEKFCRNTDATDDTIEMLLVEVKQLTQLTIDLRSQATEPGESTQPEIKTVGANMSLLALYI